MLTKERDFTTLIYGAIKEYKYKEALNILNKQLLIHPNSRAALSLLGYCFYQLQDFVSASDCYEQLTQLFPEVDEYRLYFAQSLYKADLFEAALKAIAQIENSNFKERCTKLLAAIHYGEGNLPSSRSLIEQNSPGDTDTIVNLGCLLYREGDYAKALQQFQQAIQTIGFQPQLTYNVALCYYQMKQYAQSLKYIAEVIEHGIRNHPELGVGMTTEGLEVRSVGNTLALHETALIETFNLKAAIEFNLKNYLSASEALTDMPPRSEEELDLITLHNQALVNMETEPAAGFQKLQFLIQQETFPPETFANLLLLYIKYEYYDLAADVLAENATLAYEYLSPDLFNFIEAVILRQTSPQDAFSRLDQMAIKQTDQLRRLTKAIQEARQNQNDELVRQTVHEYDVALENYIPVLMQQAKIYWDMENYQQVEKIFRKSVEFCNDHSIWRLNVAHVLFMQENKYKEACSFYEPIVKRQYDNLLSISAIILANLCVTYIMTSQNENAEELMRKIEKEEETISYEKSNEKLFHLCIVNLVIGTLYCTKGNYDFGISRVMKSLEPYQKKLGSDTWYYAKRCFLSLIENMSKHMIMLRDAVLMECIQFLEHCELYGRDIKVVIEQPIESLKIHPGQNTVTYEARLLKSLLLELI
ncbi:Tetratricopeptide repeat protein [Schistosoma japonicum]|uniref:Tetratricopeptide repeat protein 30 n=1 Tax=Schistosoma japonicum TaxID=6182 RepID=A0A4Z2D2M4_SCHJA|nr:Tetratricopeptide repeat protein 30A [Schistosoma japonicum]TNN10765.1 Tetratricopeptide repeat protein [Schistosoma japonicum]